MIQRDRMVLADRLELASEHRGRCDDVLKIHGLVVVELFYPDGTLKGYEEVENLILTAGRNMVADRLLAAPTLAVPTHMSVGTSGVAPALGDTTITGEVRVALTSKSRSGNIVTFVGDWPAGVATATLQEAGLHDAATAGTLDGRATYGSKVKEANDTLKITWTWQTGVWAP